MNADQKLLDAARVALAALQGRVSPAVAEHALEVAITEAGECGPNASLMKAAPDLYDGCVTAEFFLRTLPPDMVATLRNSRAFDAACNLRFALEEAIAKANGDDDE